MFFCFDFGFLLLISGFYFLSRVLILISDFYFYFGFGLVWFRFWLVMVRVGIVSLVFRFWFRSSRFLSTVRYVRFWFLVEGGTCDIVSILLGGGLCMSRRLLNIAPGVILASWG